MRYFIIATDKGDTIYFFKSRGKGLTKNINKAATYTEEEAETIVKTVPERKMIEVSVLSGFTNRVPTNVLGFYVVSKLHPDTEHLRFYKAPGEGVTKKIENAHIYDKEVFCNTFLYVPVLKFTGMSGKVPSTFLNQLV